MVLLCAMYGGSAPPGSDLPAFVSRSAAWSSALAATQRVALELKVHEFVWVLSNRSQGNFSFCTDCFGQFDPKCVYCLDSKMPTLGGALAGTLPGQPTEGLFALAIANQSSGSSLWQGNISITRADGLEDSIHRCDFLQSLCFAFDPVHDQILGGCSGTNSSPASYTIPGQAWQCRRPPTSISVFLRLPNDPFVVAGELSGGRWDWDSRDCDTVVALSVVGSLLCILGSWLCCFRCCKEDQ